MKKKPRSADREARRKARYRGNPERARFHRDQSADHEFVIKVSDNQAHRDSAPVPSRSRISSSHASTTPEPAAVPEQSTNTHANSNGRNNSTGRSRFEHLLPKPAIRLSSSLNAITLMQEEQPAGETEVFRATQPDEFAVETGVSPMDEDEDEDNANIDAAPEPEPEPLIQPGRTRGRKPVAAAPKSGRRLREDIDASNIDAVLQQVPARMTRSMAKRAGGVQAPRRYFGEGVSTSQILRLNNSDEQ
ncbi:hypothetical protein H4R99_002127 [Coemansia sp. RSA 1722]|nr:hypothetical protein LPJ57_004389 [Coemansia sp. RSA 486]KAJ2603932.1 hypothetical protein H4R99_002127 [Coemansia sp. RSA 1722]